MKAEQLKKTTLRRQRRRGFTLTEIAIVLGIVGLILGAIWVAAAAVYNNLRVSHTNTEILQTAQAVRTLYATQSTFTPIQTDNTAAMINAGVTPSDMKNTLGTGLTNAWGGAFAVQSTKDGLGIVLELTGVPAAQCIDLVSMVGGSTRDSGLYYAGATAAGTEMAANIGTPLTASIPPLLNGSTTASPPTGTACAAGLNAVDFGFLLKG